MSLKPRGVHFGAGNIGRGFIAPLLLKSGYHVVFADVDKKLIDTINRDRAYDVHILDATSSDEDSDVENPHGEEHRVRRPSAAREEVNRVKGVLSTTDAIYDELAHPKLRLITTAVGPVVLPKIAPTIAKGLSKRRKVRGGPINIIACENAIGASGQLAEHVRKHLTDDGDREWVENNVGFANCSVDRIVPPFDPKAFDCQSSLDVGVEEFFEWVVDSDSLKPAQALEVPIEGMTLTTSLRAYNERKLFTLNCGHAMTAYLGYLKGYATIAESIADEEIISVVRGALRNEGGKALCKRHDTFNDEQHAEYIDKIIRRFSNEAVRDEVSRVGRQPLRKLGREDRLLGPARLCIEYGFPIPNLAMGIAAALHYANDEDEQSVEMRKALKDNGLEDYVVQLMGFGKDSEACSEVLEAYKQLEGWNSRK